MRKAAEFEATSDKALFVDRLPVHDTIIAPMPEDKVSEKSIRHPGDLVCAARGAPAA